MIKRNFLLVMFTLILLLPLIVSAKETCNYTAKCCYLDDVYTEYIKGCGTIEF